MPELETDYLVVGAGASALAFVDALVANSDAQVLLVDRRDRAGGHWLNAYPFVRLHQPSAVYGVASRRLGEDRIDEAGPNAGFYERATGAEICDYLDLVLQDLLGTGQVRFLGLHDYLGQDADGHHARSLVTGADATIRARKLVDATYIASEIPALHTPAFDVADGVHLASPNQMADSGEPSGRYTVIGAGKTAMDTCCWLLDAGVDPDRIRWVRPREPWMFDRASFQPLELVGSYMELQARWVEAAAAAVDGADFAHRLEAAGVFVRIDPAAEPEAFRGPIVSRQELAQLRTLDRVVRKGKVRQVGVDRMVLDDGEVSTEPGGLYVDCTAHGVPSSAARPIFAGDQITIQYTTISGACWSAASLGAVEALRADDAEKNRLCPPISYTGKVADLLPFVQAGMAGMLARGAEPDLGAWQEGCRLNPAQGAAQRAADPKIAAAFGSLIENIGPAMRNLAQRSGAAAATPA